VHVSTPPRRCPHPEVEIHNGERRANSDESGHWRVLMRARWQAFDDSPMDWGDYGLIDELTPDAIGQIDAALRSLATTKPKKVAAIIRRVMEHSPAHVPGLPDYFYLERLCLLVESGVLKLVGDMEDPMKGEVCLPSSDA
jgi:hypothetical protein